MEAVCMSSVVAAFTEYETQAVHCALEAPAAIDGSDHEIKT